MSDGRIGPFAGIACERPYPVSGLTTQRWIAEVGVYYVLFNELTLTQDGVYFAKLFYEGLMRDSYPHAIAYSGKIYLEDGHHRVLRMALAGHTGMLMRVFKVE
jgi:hypothetical protein